ncbi:MAG: hypothetical protein WC916_01010 [Candidatus Woesearchaeota archaeon]
MADKKKKSPLEEAGKDFDWEEEQAEETNAVFTPTNYPVPDKRLRLIYEAFSLSMEETYFWILNQLQYDLSFPRVEKITDIFSASENSSFFGQASQRLSIQQDKIQTFLATTGKMVKDLFALVRELRIIDERLEAHNAWKQKNKAADVTLKEIFINFVENQGGQMKTSSVYGLAQSLGYTTLPDFFFSTKAYNKDEVDSVVDALATNDRLKNVLRRKLFEFTVWADQIEKELRNRRKFNLHYLRQHWAIIKMYMGWLKPYLRNVKRLSMNEKQILSPEIVSAFETAALEIELLAYDHTTFPAKCVLVTFKYFVKPSLSYQQPESYQRGAIHVGKVDIVMRSYGWDEEEINTYKKYREKEELELLGVIDASLKAAMDALSEDLEKYLAEAGEEEFKKMKEEKEKDTRTLLQKWLKMESADKGSKQEGIAEPFVAVFSGFGEIIGSLSPRGVFTNAPKKADASKKIAAAKSATGAMILCMRNYKKAHQLLTW